MRLPARGWRIVYAWLGLADQACRVGAVGSVRIGGSWVHGIWCGGLVWSRRFDGVVRGWGGARGMARRGLMARRSALRADSAAMLANPARGRTRYALRAALKQPPRVRSRSRPVLRQACGRVRCASRRLANRPRRAIPRARTPGARSAGTKVVGYVTARVRECGSAVVRHRRSFPVRAGVGTVVCACEAPRSAACPAAGLPKDRPAS